MTEGVKGAIGKIRNLNRRDSPQGSSLVSIDLTADKISATTLYVIRYPNRRFGRIIMAVVSGSSPCFFFDIFSKEEKIC